MDKLLVASFEELVEIAKLIATHFDVLSEDEIHEFNNLFIYKGNSQTRIADFFMNKSCVKLHSCYYCNIDYINAFRDLNKDYEDIYDFLNTATDKEMLLVYGVGKESLKEIKDKRDIDRIDDVELLNLNNPLKARLINFKFNNSHNHLTLDHFLPQTNYPFLSLCLFNFVPSCYSCNSKFKNAESLDLDQSLGHICPTSHQYSADEYLSFKLFYKTNEKDIKLTSDFNLIFHTAENNETLNSNLDTLKIKGRYLFHKEKALDLVRKKVRYTETKIESLSKLLNEDNTVIRSDLFGEELFHKDFDQAPLIKFKRDIAKHIKIS
ncbi:MAG: hypothetical protein GQ574_25440 [Crocinitomix sp.]|nr:hypothetical protein [Crocinitomix sp.]